MTISGPEALAALGEALRDIRREEGEIVRKLGRGGERIAKIRESEGELLRQFAAGRLDAAMLAELSGAIAKAGVAVRQKLRQQGAERRASAERLGRLEVRLGELGAARKAMLEEIDGQQATLRGLSARIAAAIARDPAYERHLQVSRELKSVAAEARAKARQADIDREQKGRAYRADKLFMYLLERGYGGEGYRAGPLVRRLDGQLARFVGYQAARQNFALLNDLPALLHAHAEAARGEAVATEDAIDDIERAAIDAAGGGAVRQALADAQAGIEAIDAEIVGIEDERDALIESYVVLAEAADPGFEQAVGALSRALGSTSVTALVAAARQRQAGVDDPLVAQLNDAHLRVAEEQSDTRDEQFRLRTLAARRRELEDIEYEFKAARFDDPRSTFRDNDLIGARLNSFLTGATPAASYWAAWRRGQSWSAGTSDWGGGIGLPRHGRQAGGGSPVEAEPFSRPRLTPAGAEN